MTISSILLQLEGDGWNVKEEYLENLQDKALTYQSVVRILINTDLKDYGSPSLPSDIGKGKANQIKTPIILQVTNVRNVSAPKANEESMTAPRMLRITLTDGTNYVHGLEVIFIKSLSLKIAPGTKIKLFSKIPVAGNHLMLTPSNTELVGGIVEELYQKWKLSESVSKYSRTTIVACDGSGPPPWVAFGKKILAERERNFKALEDSSAKKKENDEFEHQRQQAVMELAKESSQKVFGGGKQMLDSNVQKIINSGGFTIEEAEWALKRNKNDIQKAIQELKRNQTGGDVTSGGRGYNTYPEFEERGRGRGSKRGRGKSGRGKDIKGPDGSDDEMPHTISSKPSGPASLLDYLESRITEKTGDHEPVLRVEEKQDFRYQPRGGRRGRGRGRGDYFKPNASNFQKSEPSFSVENWPSLGEETSAQVPGYNNSSKSEPEVERNSSQSSHRYNQQNYSYSQTNSSERGYQTKFSQPNVRESPQNYRNNPNYRNSNPPPSKPAYRDQHSYQQNYYKESNQQQQQQQQQQAYRTDSQRYDEFQRDNPIRRKVEQPYYRRGMGRDLHRGSTPSMRGRSSYQGYANTTPASYYNQQEEVYRAEGNVNYNGGSARVHTTEEKELIAQFEKSMVMAGYYEEPSYMAQRESRNNYSHTYQQPQGYYNNGASQNFSGTYEFHRGGSDGNQRRGRRGRY